jgi:hypothetical protein
MNDSYVKEALKMDDLYAKDCAKLAALIERYAHIPNDRVFDLVMKNGAAKLPLYANLICETDAQWENLTALFSFTGYYNALKSADKAAGLDAAVKPARDKATLAERLAHAKKTASERNAVSAVNIKSRGAAR